MDKWQLTRRCANGLVVFCPCWLSHYVSDVSDWYAQVLARNFSKIYESAETLLRENRDQVLPKCYIASIMWRVLRRCVQPEGKKKVALQVSESSVIVFLWMESNDMIFCCCCCVRHLWKTLFRVFTRCRRPAPWTVQMTSPYSWGKYWTSRRCDQVLVSVCDCEYMLSTTGTMGVNFSLFCTVGMFWSAQESGRNLWKDPQEDVR